MATIEEARQALENARALVAQKRQEAQEVEAKLKASEQSVPQATQQSLRGGAFYGLQGRQKLRRAEEYSAELRGKQGEIEQYKQELARYETEQLNPYEQQLNQVEKEQSAYGVLNAEIERTVRKYGGQYTSANSINNIQEAFQNAGLDASQAVEAYKKAVTSPEGRYSLWTDDKKFLGTVSTEGLVVPSKDYSYLGIKDGSYQFQSTVPAISQPAPTPQQALAPTPTETRTSFWGGLKQIFMPRIFPSTKIIPESIENIQKIETWTTQSGVTRYNAELKVKQDFEKKGIVPTPEEFENAVQKKIQLTSFVQSFGVGITPAISAPKTIPIRKIAPPKFVETQQSFNIFGKTGVASKYAIKTELVAPRLQDTGQGFLFSPIAPAKVQVTKTIFPVINEGNAFTLTRTLGTAKGQLTVIGGKSIPRTLTEIRSLPKVEQYAWKGLAERIANRPVAMKNVPMLLKKEAEYAQGALNQFKLGSISKTATGFKARLLPARELGKRTSQYVTASRFEKTGTTPVYDIFKGNIAYKDVTKPFARASGRTPSLIGEIRVMKEPIVIGEASNVNFIKPANIVKTPLSKTFQQQIQQVMNIAKPAPKVVKTVQVAKSALKTTTGLKLGLGTASASALGLLTRQAPKTATPQEEGEGQGQGQGTKEIITTKPVITTKSAQKDILGLEQPQANVQKLSPLTAQTPSLALKQFLTTTTTQVPRIIRTPRTPRVPETPTPKIPRLAGGLLLPSRRVSSKAFDFFRIYGRRKGQDRFLGLATGKPQAEKRLKGFLKQTLGASGYVTRGKKPIKIDLGIEFQPAKKQPLRVVQKRGYRLGTRAEVAEIMGARRGRTRFL